MKRRPLQTTLIAALALGCGSDITAPNLPAKPAAPAVALGSLFSCALTLDAKPYCWGDNLSGQLGDSSFASRLAPGAVAGGHSFIAISSSVSTTCALEQNGAVWCWGDDPTQPGVRVSFRNLPIAIPLPRPLVTIGVGRKSACGLDTGGTAYCWGENGRGQLGVGDTLPHANPTRVLGDTKFTTISAGFWSTCALSTTSRIYCWGDNTYGELGTGDTLPATAPKQIPGSTAFRSVSLGSIHACGLTTAGAAMCWGANFSGQLGDGTAARRLSPTASAPGLTFTSLRAGRANSIFTHTCGVTPSGEVYCWGWNSKGQLGADLSNTRDDCLLYTPPGVTPSNGIPESVCSYKPVKAASMSGVVSLDAGYQHTCAVKSTSAIVCWGDNQYGQLGDGTGVGSLTPVTVKGGLGLP